MIDLLKSIYSSDQVNYLAALIVANLILGVLASLRAGDFRLTRLADWLWNRVVPLMVAYGVAGLLAYTKPELAYLQTAAFGTITLTLLGYILSNLKDFGVNIPEGLAGKE
jgi:hypothetical protein